VRSVLLDAGPSLNFLAVGQVNILVQAAIAWQAQLAVPEQVDKEIRGRCQHDTRFRDSGAPGTWRKLTAHDRVTVLVDDLGPEAFTAAVTRVSEMPATRRVRSRSSLGEIMVIAHASALVQSGTAVVVLIDERDERRRARREQRWLKARELPPFALGSTVQVLRAAKDHPSWTAGGADVQAVYDAMCLVDDGLPKDLVV
jgi:hypothetical protein